MPHAAIRAVALFLIALMCAGPSMAQTDERPNIMLIMVDDMGFSDLGSYGGEIETPNIDRLAERGLRFTQFYNTSKCFPTRASLMTGLYAHQVGMDERPEAIRNGVTIAEVLREAGYRTLMSGKWHGTENPHDRGFDRNFGLVDGAVNHFNPGHRRPGEPEPAKKTPGNVRTWAIDGQLYRPYTPSDPGFYSTDAYTDYAVRYLEEYEGDERPFFLYLAYTAPHDPLQAPAEEIEKYRGRFMGGWDELRRRRYERQVEAGLIDAAWKLSERSPIREHQRQTSKFTSRYWAEDGQILPWDEVQGKEDWDLKMAVYAAMIDRVDQQVGRLMEKIRAMGEEDNTLVLFLSDNGGSAEMVHNQQDREHPPEDPPGSMAAWHSVDAPWANVSNTPFRYYKNWSHEGGIATPLIAYWPNTIEPGGITHEISHVIDVMATAVDLAGAEYPTRYRGEEIHPLEGKSLRPILEGRSRDGHDALFFEWNDGKAVRQDRWKLVDAVGDGTEWELYDMTSDRTETTDLAERYPDKVAELAALYQAWYARVRPEADAARVGIDAEASRIEPAQLRTEYRTNPLGIDSENPRLSWILLPTAEDVRGAGQTAYRILVASSRDRLTPGRADVWDSGKIDAASPLNVAYEGPPLRSGDRVYWSVQVWDDRGAASPFSEPAWWEMGLLDELDWEGTWIRGARPTPETEEAWYDDQPAPLLRKAFDLPDQPIRRARVYVTGLGYYELSLNGERVGDHVLDPAWTNYAEHVHYSIYDVTEQLHSGENVLGLMLGNGWYNPLPLEIFGRWQLRETLPVGDPKAILQLDVEFADGTTRSISTDGTWTTADGPILKNNVYLGEVYDARKEVRGWDAPGFDDGSWSRARTAPPPGGRLVAQDIPPIKVQRTIHPVAITEPEPGVYIFDMGQNFAGWITLRVEGARGDSVVMRFGELLHEDGRINVLTSTMTQIKDWAAVSERDWDRVLAGPFWNEGPFKPATAWQSDTYILDGEGVETYTPRFTWHGFRYVEVRGFPGEPMLDALEGHLLHSDVKPAGSFSSSNELFDRVQDVTMWTMLSNLFSVQSDCPHRERFGYGGDIVAASEMGLLNLDMSRFYAKTVRDFADAQRPNGGFTEIAPDVGIDVESLGGGAGPVGWGTAHPMLLDQLHRYYGDRRLLEEQYDRLAPWIELLHANAEEGILDNGISDHESLAPKPRALTGTAFYYYNVRLAQRFAELLGRDEEAGRYAAQAERIREAFNRRFLDPASGRYDIGTQATQAFALYFDLVPHEHREAAFRFLIRDLEKHANHLTTGIFGTKYLFDVLTRGGRADLAYAVADQRSFPGYGYMLDHGATTLWESWAEPTQASHNHPMFGSVSEWFYKALLGIRPDDDAVGFDHILIEPHPVGGLTWARGYHDSVRGRITSDWRLESGRFVLETTIPVSATATVRLPAASRDDVLENGVAAHESEGVRFLRMENGRAVYEVASGSYRFSVEGSTAAR